MPVTVHKFAIPSARSEQPVMLPTGAQFLHVDAIADQPYVWARVDTNREKQPRRLAWFMTGQPVPGWWEPVGTFLVPDALGPGAPFVGHVFDGGPA